jgi:hypothetical protein
VIEQDDIPSGPQRNKLAQFRTQSVGHGDSRAKTDTSAERLQRLGAILGNGDWQALREWRLSQLAMLFPGKTFPEPKQFQETQSIDNISPPPHNPYGCRTHSGGTAWGRSGVRRGN